MKKFSPLLFLSSLGSGGIAVSLFVFINYTTNHGKGLAVIHKIHDLGLPMTTEILFRFFELNMIVFTVIHLILTFILFKKLTIWRKTDEYKNFIENPQVNTALMAPFLSITMTMNVFLAVVRYFIPVFAENLQVAMLPGLIAWILIWYFLMKTEISLLKNSFVKSFDIEKINFGWLLHPFALMMLTVTGTGIAALSQNTEIAHVAAFMSLVSGTMGMTLLFIQLTLVFKGYFFNKQGLGENQFLPGFLIVIPSITLFAISLFRFGHYLENQFSVHFESYFMIVTTIAFAFEVWYILFGLSMMKDYLKTSFNKEYTVTQWGLICPMVAFSVLGSFVYKEFYPSVILYWLIVAGIIFTIYTFFKIGKKHLDCRKGMKKNNLWVI